MSICIKCKVDKPISEFYVYKDKPNASCKSCTSIAGKERQRLKKIKDKENYTVPLGLVLSNRIKQEEENNGYSRTFVIRTAIQMFIETDHEERVRVFQRYLKHRKPKN